MFGILRFGPHGVVRINGWLGTEQESLRFFLFGLIVGVAISALAIRLMMGWTFERVELGERMISWFDWRNRKQLSAELSTLRSVRDRSGVPFLRQGYSFWRPQGRPFSPAVERISIVLEDGEIPVSGTIERFDDLQARVHEEWRRKTNIDRPL